MKQIIEKSSFSLCKIDDEYKANFKPMRWEMISDAQKFLLRVVGNAIRSDSSVYFWVDGCFSWWNDRKQVCEQRVWMTENGIVMFEDCWANELFRVLFKY